MATRALININQGQTTLCTIYKHYDGYPDSLGSALADFLRPIAIVNGLGGDYQRTANGMPCLAAQVVAHLKDGAGDVYLYPPGEFGMCEEYVYDIYPHAKGLRLAVHAVDFDDNKTLIFDGLPNEWVMHQLREAAVCS